MSNNGVSFKVAVREFAQSSRDLALATAQLPFTGSWKRTVVIGLPVLLLASGVGALVFAVMLRCLGWASRALYSGGTQIYKNIFNRQSAVSVTHYHVPPSWLAGLQASLLHPSSKSSSVPAPTSSINPPNPSVPLPVEAAKERNASLLQLLGLIEKLVIDPLVAKQSLYSGELYTSEGLKSWLMCMTLWRLAIAWEELDQHYVRIKTPPPPTTESIVNEAKKIDNTLGDSFAKSLSQSEKNFSKFTDDIVKREDLTPHQKGDLLVCCLKLEVVCKQTNAHPKNKEADEKEMHKQFALAMHHGVANTLSHLVQIVEGWSSVLGMTSTPAAPPFSLKTKTEEGSPVEELSKMVRGIFDQVKEDVTSKYLMPLSDKKYQEWTTAFDKDLRQSIKDCPFHSKALLKEGKDIKNFLKGEKAQQISTLSLANLFFLKAVDHMQRDKKHFGAAIKEVLGSVLAQLEPKVIDILKKSCDMILQISFNSAVPKVVDYLTALLKCCTAMQNARNESSLLDEGQFLIISNINSLEKIPLAKALEKAQLLEQEVVNINRLYKETGSQVSGKDIISKLPHTMVHKTVLDSLDSPLEEEEWFRIKKEQLKTALQRAKQYAEQEGQWLSNLLKENPQGQTNSIVSLFLILSDHLRQVPGLENVMAFVFSGIQALLESTACKASQTFVNELTSTGYLASIIATSVMKSLLAKDQKKWEENLTVIQKAYQFLQPKEQEQIINYLKVQCGTDITLFEQRQKALSTPSKTDTILLEVDKMKEREKNYADAEDKVRKTFQIHLADPKSFEQAQFEQLVVCVNKLQREKELAQFARAKALVTYVADVFLSRVCTFNGGETLKQICIKVLDESLMLLTCQEIVKHWIFSLIDLLIEELKHSNHSERNPKSMTSSKDSSLLDFIDSSQQETLLDSLVNFLNATERDKGWMSFKAWAIFGSKAITKWAPNTIWDYIKQYKDQLKITPQQLRDKVVTSIHDFGTDPKGLSELLIQALKENVADVGSSPASASGKEEVTVKI